MNVSSEEEMIKKETARLERTMSGSGRRGLGSYARNRNSSFEENPAASTQTSRSNSFEENLESRSETKNIKSRDMTNITLEPVASIKREPISITKKKDSLNSSSHNPFTTRRLSMEKLPTVNSPKEEESPPKSTKNQFLDKAKSLENKRSSSLVNTVFSWPYPGNEVHLAGTFNGWKPFGPLERKNEILQTTIPLPPGVHQYKFIVDGRWCFDMARQTVTDPHGNINNVIQVTEVERPKNKNRSQVSQ